MLFCLQIYKNNPFFFLYHSEYSKFLSISLNATVFSKKKPQQKKTSCSLSTEVLNVSGSSACHREPHNMAYNSAMKTGAHTQVLVPMTIRQKQQFLFTHAEQIPSECDVAAKSNENRHPYSGACSLDSFLFRANWTNRNAIFSYPVRTIKMSFAIIPIVVDDNHTCTGGVANIEI